MVETIRKQNPNSILLDGGDIFSPEKDNPDIRGAAITAGMAVMGYDGVAVGDKDLSLGLDFFRMSVLKNKLPAVSANVVIKDAPNSGSVIDAYLIKKVGHLSVGFTSVCDPAFFQLSDSDRKYVDLLGPAQSLKKTVSGMKNKSDIVVVMLHLGHEHAEKFVKDNVFEPTIFIVGHGNNMSDYPVKINNSWLVQGGDDGKYLSVLTVNLDKNKKPLSVQFDNIPLLPKDPENRKVSKIIEGFEEKKSERSKPSKSDSPPVMSEKERQEILKLSPEEFLKKMGDNEN